MKKEGKFWSRQELMQMRRLSQRYLERRLHHDELVGKYVEQYGADDFRTKRYMRFWSAAYEKDNKLEVEYLDGLYVFRGNLAELREFSGIDFVVAEHYSGTEIKLYGRKLDKSGFHANIGDMFKKNWESTNPETYELINNSQGIVGIINAQLIQKISNGFVSREDIVGLAFGYRNK